MSNAEYLYICNEREKKTVVVLISGIYLA